MSKLEGRKALLAVAEGCGVDKVLSQIPSKDWEEGCTQQAGSSGPVAGCRDLQKDQKYVSALR